LKEINLGDSQPQLHVEAHSKELTEEWPTKRILGGKIAFHICKPFLT